MLQRRKRAYLAKLTNEISQRRRVSAVTLEAPPFISIVVQYKMDGDIGNWVSGIPVVTRYWFFSFFILPLTTRLGLIDPINLVLLSNKVIGGFQVRELM